MSGSRDGQTHRPLREGAHADGAEPGTLPDTSGVAYDEPSAATVRENDLHEIMPGCPTACGGEEWHPC